MSPSRKIWSGSWSYPEGWIIATALLLLSLLWQGIMGPIPQRAVPHTIVIGGVILLVVVALLCVIARERRHCPAAVRFLFSPAATISSITLFLIVLLVAGFTSQVPPEMAMGLGGVIHHMGFTSVVHSFPFVTSYIYLLLVLLCVTGRRLWHLHFRRPLRDIAFVLNHFGLAYFLVFALLSGSAMERYRMTVAEGQTEWRAEVDDRQEMVELPVAIELHDFRLEEYPPKLMLLHGEAGLLTTTGRKGSTPLELLIDREPPFTDRLGEWDVTVEELLPLAAPVMSDDDLRYVDWGSEGAATAAHVTARKGTIEASGWVSCGSYLIPYRALTLQDSLTLVMPDPEPKQYYSDISYYTPTGKSGRKTISVNDPLRLGEWYIYQLNYDRTKGRWSEVTQLELVRDPYMTHIYIGLLILLAGAILLIFSPPLRR